MLVETLDQISNIEKLVQEVSELISKVAAETSQISCQMSTPESENYLESTGSLSNLENKLEAAYQFIPQSLKDTEIAKIIQHYKGYRARIMRMEPRKCYSVHRDIFKRIHVPIVTNEQCWMIWPYENGCFHLEQGFAYLTDTTQAHTFINGHDSQIRIHLVMSIIQK